MWDTRPSVTLRTEEGERNREGRAAVSWGEKSISCSLGICVRICPGEREFQRVLHRGRGQMLSSMANSSAQESWLNPKCLSHPQEVCDPCRVSPS